MVADAVPDLEFSRKYGAEHARRYFDKHRHGMRRFNDLLEQFMARRGLRMAGNPQTVLDVPCGAGRFWKTLTEEPGRVLYAADNSWDMVHTARTCHDPKVVARFKGFVQLSAFSLPLSANSVEAVFCIRLLHHIGKREDRLTLLREFARVAQRSVLVSLWVDGNFKGWRRQQSEVRRPPHHYQNRFLIPRKEVEEEFAMAGLAITGHVDMVKYYSMWRLYVLSPTGGDTP